jgi:PhnB protein
MSDSSVEVEGGGDVGVATSIAPWWAVSDGARAVAYYRQALGAVDVYRLDGDGGTVAVAQLKIGAAAFWVQEDPESSSTSRDADGAGAVRLILTVDDPDALFARAVAAGATPIAPPHEAHGWRSARITDPFGHDWEFAKPLAPAAPVAPSDA